MKFWLLIVMLSLLVWESHGAVRKRTPEIPVQSSRSLRQVVDSYAEMLEKEVRKAKNNKERFRSHRRVLGQIRILRDNSVTQSAQDEAHMDLLVSSLEAIPEEKKFKQRECARYESDFLEQFEPTAEEAPQEPAIKPSWEVLRSLCK